LFYCVGSPQKKGRLTPRAKRTANYLHVQSTQRL
jgi:hypothetical protein